MNFAPDIFLPSGMVGIVVLAMWIESASITAHMCLPRSQSSTHLVSLPTHPPPLWLQQTFTWTVAPLLQLSLLTLIPSSPMRREPADVSPRGTSVSTWLLASLFLVSKGQLILS